MRKYGYDSGEEYHRRMNLSDVERMLSLLREHHRNPAWLKANAAPLHDIMRFGLDRPQVQDRIIEWLFTIAPHMLVHDQYKRWSELILQALLRAFNLRNDTLIGRVWVLMGDSKMLGGDARTASIAYNNAFQRAQARKSDELMLLAYIGLFKTQTYNFSQDFTTSSISRALALADSLHDPILTAWLYRALAMLYVHRDEFALGFMYAQAAFAFWYARGRRAETADLAAVLAHCARRIGRDALALQVRAVADHMGGDDQRTAAFTLYDRAIEDYLKGDYEAAIARLGEAMSRYQALRFEHQVTMCYHMLGLVHTERPDERRLARVALGRALEGWQALDNRFEQASALQAWGYLEVVSGNYDAARLLLLDALRLLRTLPVMPSTQDIEQRVWDTLREIPA
jgi:tetratricopeptide (TPR) repeat protein